MILKITMEKIFLNELQGCMKNICTSDGVVFFYLHVYNGYFIGVNSLEWFVDDRCWERVLLFSHDTRIWLGFA